MLTIVSPEGKIDNVVLIEDSETFLYLMKVLTAGYPENLRGRRSPVHEGYTSFTSYQARLAEEFLSDTQEEAPAELGLPLSV